MSAFAPPLIIASAAIIFLLGLVHLAYTFRGTKLHPRDAALQARMNEVSPVITRQTTMWKAWIGFNASHSFGAILFGAVYGYLAMAHSEFLFRSPFLLVPGLLLLGGYVFLGKVYWFSVPFRGIVLSAAFYLAALVFVVWT
ncbi:MAG: LIC_13387 family protein [Burkholderiales bacterium]